MRTNALCLQEQGCVVGAKRGRPSKYFDRGIDLRHEDWMSGQAVCKPLVNLPHALTSNAKDCRSFFKRRRFVTIASKAAKECA